VAEGAIERVIVEPAPALLTEALESLPLLGGAPLLKHRERLSEHPLAEVRRGLEIDAISREIRLLCEVIGREEPLVGQDVEADKEGVPGERRSGAVRGAAFARRAHRQHLPEALPGGSEETNEAARAIAEIATSIRTRQARRV
jgi:hypothetical protein